MSRSPVLSIFIASVALIDCAEVRTTQLERLSSAATWVNAPRNHIFNLGRVRFSLLQRDSLTLKPLAFRLAAKTLTACGFGVS